MCGMKLSDKAIQDFKKIYQKRFKIRLSDDDANRLGIELLNFVKLMYRPNLDKTRYANQ